MKRVLLVEPDRLQAEVYQSALKSDYDVSWSRTAQGAIAALDSRKYDVVITETVLDHHNGVELLSEMRAYEDWLDVPVVILSSIPEEKFAFKAWRDYGVKAYLNKSDTRPLKLRATLAEVVGEAQ